MHSPNVLLTNFCNQDCSFCFAKKLMSHTSMPKEMSMKDFKSVVRKIKRANINTDSIKLLGGEPTLHSQFEEIIDYSLKHFSIIQLFTNGIFSDKTAEFMKKYLPRIKFIFNVMTPGFQENGRVKNLVLKKILEFSDLTETSLSITINPRFDIDPLINLLGVKTLQKIYCVRIGASNPIAGGKNLYKLHQLRLLGNSACNLVEKLSKINKKIVFHLDCGFARCMFSNEQHLFLNKERVRNSGWGCVYGNVDIQTNMEAIPCYSLSEIYKLSLKKLGINKIQSKFILKEYSLTNKYLPDDCKNCPYFGFDKNKCLGFCIGLEINQAQSIKN